MMLACIFLDTVARLHTVSWGVLALSGLRPETRYRVLGRT